MKCRVYPAMDTCPPVVNLNFGSAESANGGYLNPQNPNLLFFTSLRSPPHSALKHVQSDSGGVLGLGEWPERKEADKTIMVADKTKKLKVSEKGENTEEIDGELVLSIEKLQEIQDELEKINEEASDKVLEIEQKYNEVRKPVYDRRNEIIKSIPDFWTTAFLSHPALGELLNKEDQQIFKYLSSLEVEDFKDVKSGYSITFNFNSNPYFEDTKLTKTFTFHEEGTTKITATPIKWKEGKGLPNGVSHEKKGNKRAPTDISFFSWFSDTEQRDEMDDIHDEVAELIKDDLWPNPLTYFNNFVTKMEQEEPDEEDADEEEGDDEEKDEDDSEDDDDQEDDDEEGEE